VHAAACYHLSDEDEKAEYDKHQNSFDDEGYRGFLARMAEPIIATLPAGSEGLEFGCGPGPVLAKMLEQSGYEMTLYDKFYADNQDALLQTYDFITATEVVEHLRQPNEVLAQLWSLLKPGGTLGIMTKQVTTQEAFSAWHYKNDQTHIVFFHSKTFQWLSEKWGASLSSHGADVVLLKKPL
tara:strand:- start:19494 stop:20039 length:546 start_codon:yes stop_codon:yes gene_type:complete